MTPRRRSRTEAGQATVWIIVVMVVVGAIVGALVELGAESVARGRLQAVADLTALAAAHDAAAGAAVATSNGVALVEVRPGADRSVTVVVARDGRRAVASAST